MPSPCSAPCAHAGTLLECAAAAARRGPRKRGGGARGAAAAAARRVLLSGAGAPTARGAPAHACRGRGLCGVRAPDGARAAGAQGIVGNIPGQAVAFMTLFLQLLGMTDFWASALVALGMFAHALGGQAGGFLGDWAARRSPRYGRIVVCQVSVAAGAAPGVGASFFPLPAAGGAAARGQVKRSPSVQGRPRTRKRPLCYALLWVCMLRARRRAERGSRALSEVWSLIGLLPDVHLAAASHKHLSGIGGDQRAARWRQPADLIRACQQGSAVQLRRTSAQGWC